jgi:uncharacterized protein
MGRMLIVAAAAALLLVQNIYAQEGPDRRISPVPTISVTGEGRVSMDPDVAVVRLGVTAQEQEAAAAQGRVNETMRRVLDAVRQIVPGEQVQTSGLSLYPVYSTQMRRTGDEVGEPRISGYRADMSIAVRIRELGRVGEVIDAGLKAGANRLEGVSFELESDLRAKSQALQQAARAAQGKARALASAMDVEIVGILDVIEGGSDVVRPMFDMHEVAGRAMAMPATPIEAGQVHVSAHVTLRYRISGAGLGRGDAPIINGAERGQLRRDRIGEPALPAGSQPR